MPTSSDPTPSAGRVTPAMVRIFRLVVPDGKERLTIPQRFLLGGIGALVPLLLNAALIDTKTVFVSLTGPVALAYAVKSIALIAVGGLVALRYGDDRSPWRLVELGIGAPALVSTMMNSAVVEPHAGLPAAPPADTTVAVGAALPRLPGLVAPAYAQERTRPSVLSFREPPPEPVKAQLLRGLTGATSRGAAFVYLDQAFPTPESAHRRRVEVERLLGQTAMVYGTDGPLKGYVVVLGDWMRPADARRLQESLQRRDPSLRIAVWTHHS